MNMASEELYSRTEMILGSDMEKLKRAKVLVCGLGGVGGYVLEALARAGVGRIDVLDNDVFSPTNLNRQILATVESVGKKKTEIAIARIKSINPNCECKAFDMFYLPETADELNLTNYEYIADAIDTVTAKTELIARAKAAGTPIISCMGTGNKLGTEFRVDDISKTKVCPLAKAMRKKLKECGIESGVKAVYSLEEPKSKGEMPTENGRHIPGSISYAPAIAGLMLAAEIIKDLIK